MGIGGFRKLEAKFGIKGGGLILEPLARIMHRFLSRSDESADLTRRGGTRLRVGGPRKRTVGTLRRPTERNTGRADDFVAAVENLCIIRARDHTGKYADQYDPPAPSRMFRGTRFRQRRAFPRYFSCLSYGHNGKYTSSGGVIYPLRKCSAQPRWCQVRVLSS